MFLETLNTNKFFRFGFLDEKSYLKWYNEEQRELLKRNGFKLIKIESENDRIWSDDSDQLFYDV